MKVGDYVRTKQGIEKIKVVEENFMGDENCFFYATDNKEWNGAYNGKYNGFTNRNRTIIKSSPNIIDLIEVGDIVELEESDDIACMFFRDVYRIKNEDNLFQIVDNIKNNKCKLLSIITKEQFKSMQYKVKE